VTLKGNASNPQRPVLVELPAIRSVFSIQHIDTGCVWGTATQKQVHLLLTGSAYPPKKYSRSKNEMRRLPHQVFY